MFRLAAILWALAAVSAAAEPVYIKASNDRVGQGWLFWDPATQSCSVITAGHVVRPDDVGRLLIVGTRDVEGSATAVQIISPALDEGGLDVALITVGGPLASQGCTSSVIGSTNLTYTLQRLPSGTVEFVDRTHEIVRHDVDFKVANTARPEIVAINVHDLTDQIEQGFSGSAVLNPAADRSGPGAPPLALAMIIQTTAGGSSVAVRYDAIWRLVRTRLGAAKVASPARHDAHGAYHLAWWSSGTVDPACPAANAIAAGAACPWRVRPQGDDQSAQVIVALDGANPTVSGVTLAISVPEDQGRHPDASIEVSADESGDNWSWMGHCDPVDGGAKCSFGQTGARRIRITVADPDQRELGIRLTDMSR